MCHPPTPELKLKQEKIKQVKKVTFDMNVTNFSLSGNNKSKPSISNELLIKSMVNSFYKFKLDQSLLQVKALEEILQEYKERENELKEIIYNLKNIIDEMLIKKNEITLINNIRRCSLTNVTILHNTTV